MKIHFELPQFDAQLLRTLSYSISGGADIGECMQTAIAINEDNFDLWFDKWYETAERIREQAEISYAEGHLASAKECFLRASNYYRTAYFFLYESPPTEKLLEGYQKHAETFSRALELMKTEVQAVRIPFENTTLTGYYYLSEKSHKKRPVIIANGGYDSTQQELYFLIVKAALLRGYHVLTFDGPGQGEALFEQDMHMRPDWEKVISACINFLLKTEYVEPKKIALMGISFGGFLSARAASFENRLAALVANPGQIDLMESMKENIPEITTLLENDENHVLEKYLTTALTNKMWASKFKAKMWVHGVESPIELLKEWRNYNISDMVKTISCPTLVCDSENEQYSRGQAKKLFETLQCEKKYILFKSKEGAGEHCQAGALSLFHQKTFDWLDHILQNSTIQASTLSVEYKSTHTI